MNDSTFKSWLFVGNQSQGGAEASASACSSNPKMFCSVCQKPGKSNIFTLAYKHFVGLHRNKSFPEFCEILIKDQSDVFPDFIVFAELALVVPLNSASCERGFSAQNKIKSKSRNRSRDEQVDRLMKIAINCPHYAEYDYTAAKNNFQAMKDRIQ